MTLNIKRHEIFFLFLLVVSNTLHAAQTKYGDKALPLHLPQAHEYFQKNPAPDYWAIAPYYTAQQDGRSCSVATIVMLLNALRTPEILSSETPLVTQKNILKKLHDQKWNQNIGLLGHGVTLDEMKGLTEKALKTFNLPQSVDVYHAPEKNADVLKFKDRLHHLLIENEKDDRNFIVINFLQGRFTSDADVGHFAIIGAYDSKKRRVLVMDPDREWYEPYWISEETLFEGLNTLDTVSQQSRGYLWIRS